MFVQEDIEMQMTLLPTISVRTWFLFKRNERDYPWLTRFLDGV